MSIPAELAGEPRREQNNLVTMITFSRDAEKRLCQPTKMNNLYIYTTKFHTPHPKDKIKTSPTVDGEGKTGVSICGREVHLSLLLLLSLLAVGLVIISLTSA